MLSKIGDGRWSCGVDALLSGGEHMFVELLVDGVGSAVGNPFMLKSFKYNDTVLGGMPVIFAAIAATVVCART